MIEVKLPQTTDEPEDSVIILWYKSEGETVEEHEVLVEVQTEKATYEVDSPAAGILRKILVKRAETASVGQPIAIIETKEDTEQSNQEVVATVLDSGAEADSVNRSDEHGKSAFVEAPPRMRNLARKLGVDLAEVKGTGPNGRITEQDIQMVADSRGTKVTPTRKTIARRMMQSLQQSAQLTLTSWADVTELAAIRKELAPDISWNGWILKATVLALKDHPDINSTWDEDGIKHFDSIHLGIAVDTQDGLLVPVVREAKKLTLHELSESASGLAAKARDGKLSASELTGGTFTVTNLGAYGIEFFTPIINPPEAAILGVGKLDKRLGIKNDTFVQEWRVPLSLTFDHRIIDGGPAARFLETVSKYLMEPKNLL